MGAHHTTLPCATQNIVGRAKVTASARIALRKSKPLGCKTCHPAAATYPMQIPTQEHERVILMRVCVHPAAAEQSHRVLVPVRNLLPFSARDTSQFDCNRPSTIMKRDVHNLLQGTRILTGFHVLLLIVLGGGCIVTSM